MKTAWDIWGKNFENAKRFFNSKGNIHTKSRLKDKWHNDFMNDLKEVGLENVKIIMCLSCMNMNVKVEGEGSSCEFCGSNLNVEDNKEELCECGHTYKEHNYNLIKNNKFPDGKLLGDGTCLGDGEGNAYCKCKKFAKESKEVKKP